MMKLRTADQLYAACMPVEGAFSPNKIQGDISYPPQ